MTRKNWSAVEISAYLDGVLDHEAHATFEASLKRDKSLREKVDTVRETIHFVKSAPMRTPPRNYLLTPAMVKERQSQLSQPRHTSLRWMRLATSLTAVAFIITLGLNLLDVTPKMAMAPDIAEPVMMAQESKTNWADENIAEEDRDVLIPQQEQVMLTPQIEENASPVLTPGAGGFGEGIGVAPAASIQGNIQETGQESDGAEENMAYAEKAVPPSDTTSVTMSAIIPTQIPEAMMDSPPPSPEIAMPSPRVSFPIRWVIVLLGLITMGLAFLTFKMSRRS